MNESPTILTSSDLLITFLSNVSSRDVRFISGRNPFAIKIDGEDTFIYIKNLSPAQLSNNNPDIWRIQLPTKKEFGSIKVSTNLFLLLGYDAENKVYTSWNPYWCKQRLNVGKSVSMYSRLSLQKRVSESGKIEKIELNNDGDVVCIPANKIYDYIKSIKEYYPEETVFVAKGSSIQKRLQDESVSLFNFFVENTTSAHFAEFLRKKDMSNKSIRDYTRYTKFVKEAGYLEKYKKEFLLHNSIESYKEAIKSFIQQKEIAAIDEKWHGYIRASLNHYYSFLMSLDYHRSSIEPETNQQDLFSMDTNEVVSEYKVDKFGKLLELSASVVKILYPYIKDEEYPDYEAMIDIANEQYPTMITDVMTPVDWIKLFDKTIWKPKKENTRQNKSANSTKTRTRRPNLSIKVTEADGTVIQKETPQETFIYMIEKSYPELIVEIDFGRPVISREKFPDFPGSKRSQQKIDGGFYLSTNFDARDKVKILQKISDKLGLNWTIDVIE